VGIAQWPSLAVGYTLSGDGTADPSIALTLTLQLQRYTVSAELSAECALRNAETDRAAYARADAQLAQPGVAFALTTSLEQSAGAAPVNHPLDIAPFRSFVTSARPALDALPSPVSIGMAPVSLAAKLAAPIVPLRVTVTQSRDPASIAPGDNRIPDLTPSAVDAMPQNALRNVFALDAFARSVEAALPGVHVATGEPDGDHNDASGRRLWLVNVASPRGPAMTFAFEPASEVRSFAIPPLSTSLASGTATVIPYVAGSGLSGTPEPRAFAAIDLDAWASTFLEAMDLVALRDDVVSANGVSPSDAETIAGAKRALATAIAARLEDVLARDGAGESGSSARRRDAAIAAMQRLLNVALANAYAVESIVQAAVVVTTPDMQHVPHLSGRPVLTQPGTDSPVLDASFLPGMVRLSNAHGAPALASFPLAVHAPENARSVTVSIGYEVVEIEHASSWLTLIHPLDPAMLAGVTLPIPLRTYPRPPSFGAAGAAPSFAAPVGTNELVRWDARATWVQHAADQDEIVLAIGLGTAHHDPSSRMHHHSSNVALFAALAQFITVWPDVRDDLTMPAQREPGAPLNTAPAGALAALAKIATAVAAAWPPDAPAPRALHAAEPATPAAIAPGTYGYKLTWPRDDNADLSTVTVIAESENPPLPWPELAVDAGLGMRALSLQTSTPAQAVYAYPPGIPKVTALTYQATVRQLDIMTIASFALRASVVRNAVLIDGEATSPSFVCRTPYVGPTAPLIPMLRIDTNFDIGSGTVHQLEPPLKTFLSDLLKRESAAPGSQRALHVAVSYGEDPLPAIPIALIPSVLLTINGDGGASIHAFAHALAETVAAWDAQVQAPHTNAAVLFDVSVLPVNAGAGDEPLLVARSVRYVLV
jgi:hypothetical protein